MHDLRLQVMFYRPDRLNHSTILSVPDAREIEGACKRPIFPGGLRVLFSPDYTCRILR
jgi:hypothetical protein